MKDFNNTFISTKHLTREQLTALYLKYKEVLEKSGCSLTYIKTDKFLCRWDYLYVKGSSLSYSDDHHYYLSKVCKLKEITEQDLDNYLKEQDGRIKYEKVEGMTISDVVDAIVGGDELYIRRSSESYTLILPYVSISLLTYCVNNESIYRKVEAPWWDKYKGSFVAVRDCEYQNWQYDVFEEYNEVADYKFQCKFAGWDCMRPLTKAEKEAIITEG